MVNPIRYIQNKFDKNYQSEQKLEMSKKNCTELEYVYDSAINEADSYKQECLGEMENFYKEGTMDSVNEMAYNAADMDEVMGGYREERALIKTARIELNRPRIPETKLEEIINGIEELTNVTNSTKDSNKIGRLSTQLHGLRQARGLVRALNNDQRKKVYIPTANVKTKAESYIRNCKAKVDLERSGIENKEAIIQQGLSYQNLPELQHTNE